jgi:hypothetical protein
MRNLMSLAPTEALGRRCNRETNHLLLELLERFGSGCPLDTNSCSKFAATLFAGSWFSECTPLGVQLSPVSLFQSLRISSQPTGQCSTFVLCALITGREASVMGSAFWRIA